MEELAGLGATAIVAQQRHLGEPCLVPGRPSFRARLEDLAPVGEGAGSIASSCRRARRTAERFRRTPVACQHLLVTSPGSVGVTGAEIEVGEHQAVASVADLLCESGVDAPR